MRAASRTAAALALAILALAAGEGMAAAQVTPGDRRLSGVAYDSLRMRPLAGALMSIEGTARSVIADDSGRFVFDSLAPGVHTLLMQHELLDELGMPFVRRRVEVSAADATVRIAIPPLTVHWRRACGDVRAPRDSGVVFGTVRETGTGRGVVNATVQATWNDVAFDPRAGLSQQRLGGDVTTDGDGRYAMCGVPNGALLQMRARTAHSSTDWIEVGHLSPGVTRRDLLVAALADTGKWVGAVGTVRARNGQPVPTAIVKRSAGDEVRTDSAGRFTLVGLRPGTRSITVRAIGSQPTNASVDADLGEAGPNDVAIGRVAALDTVVVEASLVQRRFVADLQYRQSLGIAKFVDSTLVEKLTNLQAVLTSAANLRFLKDGSIQIGPRCSGGFLAFWIDRRHVAPGDVAAELRLVTLTDIASVEVYDHSSALPVEFWPPGAGGLPRCALIIWTKRMVP